MPIDVAEGTSVNFVCRSSGSASTALFDGIFHRSKYVDLRRATEPLPLQRELGKDLALRLGILIPGIFVVSLATIIGSGVAGLSFDITAYRTAALVTAWTISLLIVPLPQRRANNKKICQTLLESNLRGMRFPSRQSADDLAIQASS